MVQLVCCCRCRCEFDVGASGVETIKLGTSGGGQDLEWHGTVEVAVASGVRGKEVVAAYVHHNEGVVGDETAAVCSRLEAMAADLDGNFGNEVGLISFLHRAGIAGCVDESGE